MWSGVVIDGADRVIILPCGPEWSLREEVIWTSQ